MITIDDVAKMAGVSHGTASNVLNKRGNVSSEKIRLVEQAAKKLGYAINENAKMLRKGSNDSLAVILPNIAFKQYRDFYTSFKNYAAQRGYATELMLSNDSPDQERALIQQAKATMQKGIALVSCLYDEADKNIFHGIERVCHVERKPKFPVLYYGFHYKRCGKEIAQSIQRHHIRSVLLIHQPMVISNEKEIVEAFCESLQDTDCDIIDIATELLRIPNALLEIFDDHHFVDAIVTTNFGFAEKIRQILNSLMHKKDIPIYTVSPMFTLPETDYRKYELNYSLLGRQVAEACITQRSRPSRENILQNDGFRKWHNFSVTVKTAEVLNVLALKGPESLIMKGLARLYEERIGTQIKITVASYEEIYDLFVGAQTSNLFDIFRIDVTWLSWFAEKILLPLDRLDEGILHHTKEYMPALIDQYCRVNGRIYTLPVTPSAQLLFYRKDLIEDAAVKREYWETCKEELNVPKDFREFNRVADFFTREVNENSRVQYGTSVILENTSVIATEFLTRFFSRKNNLYSTHGKIILNDDIAVEAMRDLLHTVKHANTHQVSWWTDAAKMFANGNVAMQIMYSNYASDVFGYKSKITDKVGYSIVPGGNPLLGGGSLGISKSCKYPEDALEFIKWLTTDPIASAMAALGSVSPCAKTYEIYEIIDAFPWLEMSQKCFALSQTARLPADDLRPFNEKKFLDIVGTAVKDICIKKHDIRQTLFETQSLLDKYFNHM